MRKCRIDTQTNDTITSFLNFEFNNTENLSDLHHSCLRFKAIFLTIADKSNNDFNA